MDRRQRRTKQRIREAFITLVHEVGVKKITVSQLARQADINRGTFYLHYESIEDLLDSLQQEIIADLEQHTRKLDPTEIMEDQTKLYPLLLRIIVSFSEHADLIPVFLGPQGDPSFLITWEQLVANIVLQKFQEVPEEKQDTPISPNYLATIVSSVYTGIVLEWIDQGMKESPEEIAHIISHFAIQPLVKEWQTKSDDTERT